MMDPSPSPSADPAEPMDPIRSSALPDEPLVPQVPDGIEPVVGWRYWRVDGTALASITRDSAWPPLEPFAATCRLSGRHGPVPGEACNCGVYAARDLATLQAMATPHMRDPLAVGKVALWGRLIPAERGYRAQYGYPRRLWLVWESLDSLGQPGAQRIGLAEAYGVPVEFCDADWALAACAPGPAGRPSCRRPAGSLVRLASLLLGLRTAGRPGAPARGSVDAPERRRA